MITKNCADKLSLVFVASMMMYAGQAIANDDDHGHDKEKEHHEKEHHDEHGHEKEEDHHDDHKGGLDAHEHGHGQLNVVVDESEVHIEFHVPAMNLVGFEHKPKTEEQKNRVAAAVEQLQQADALFEVNKEAQCDFSSVSAEHHEPEEGGEHSEFEASYVLKCAKPDELKQLGVPLFDVLEGMEEIKVQLVTPTLQTLVEVSENEKTIPLSQ